MADALETLKVVLGQTVLQGSNHPELLQRVATVYIKGEEYRVAAPPAAKGNAIDWSSHFTVRQLVDFNSERDIRDSRATLILNAVIEELEKNRRNRKGAEGMHPDGSHCNAQICSMGHVQHCDGTPFDSNAHCNKCGALCVAECSHCKEPIRGARRFASTATFVRPEFCHGCGRPYPWMEDRLRTVRKLLDHDNKLSPEDRDEIQKLLHDVISDPKADLVPAKKKLIDISLAKATTYVREAVLELLAKTIVETLKG